MAMNKAVLGKALADLVISPDAPADQQATILQMWTDIADAIITHIQDNAVVQAGIAVTVAPTTGTGSTTGTGTIQ